MTKEWLVRYRGVWEIACPGVSSNIGLPCGCKVTMGEVADCEVCNGTQKIVHRNQELKLCWYRRNDHVFICFAGDEDMIKAIEEE